MFWGSTDIAGSIGESKMQNVEAEKEMRKSALHGISDSQCIIRFSRR